MARDEDRQGTALPRPASATNPGAAPIARMGEDAWEDRSRDGLPERSASAALRQLDPASPNQPDDPNGRAPSGDGIRADQAGRDAGDSQLPAGAGAIPTPLPGTTRRENSILTALKDRQGTSILSIIGERWTDAREDNSAGAWRQLLADLMESIPFLVPSIIPLKDLLSTAADIEDRIKGTTARAGKSNDELMIDFLNGGSSLGDIKPPEPPFPPTLPILPLDTPAILSNDEEEFQQSASGTPAPVGSSAHIPSSSPPLAMDAEQEQAAQAEPL